MFSRNNRLDYQLFFRTRGAFNPSAGWNELIVVACVSNALLCTALWGNIMASDDPFWYVMVILLLAILQFLRSAASKLLTCNPMRRAISLLSPMVAILLLGPFVLGLYIDSKSFIPKKTMAKWMIAYVVLLVLMLLLTISRLQFPSIIKLLNGTLGSKQEFWCQFTLKLCIIASIIMPVLIVPDTSDRYVIIILEALALVLVLFGNLQIPTATVRVALALLRLLPHNYYSDDEPIDEKNFGDKTNLVASLNIFYGMVLGQGILYITACIFEVFSFIPRRSLIRHGGFEGQWGVASINLYYAHAFEKYMEGGVLAPKKISLVTFAMDSLNSDSPKMQLYSVQMLHIFLQREPIRERVIAKLTTSTKNMARLINMLGWTSPSHKVVRLYAAKATVELAKSLRVVTVPGTMQLVSSLLDIDGKQKRGNPLLDVDGDHEGKLDPTYSTSESQEERHDAIRDTAAEECQDCHKKQWGTTNGPSKVITEGAAKADEHWRGNRRSIADLRYKISKHPFLLRNLGVILGDNSSDQELSKLVAGILRNLAIDRDTRQEIGHMQVLITRLMKTFLNLDRTSSTNVDCLLPKVAEQALAMLAMDNVLERIMNVEGAELEILIGLCSHICKVIPKEFVQELEGGQIKKRFMKRLVDTLNANMNPGGHCSGIRRVIIEQSIYMMECNSHYANCFNELQMMEALSMVEEMPSRAENYRIFLGDVGFMEYSTPLIALVDRAKELMGQQCLQGVSSAN
ncbi:hypothetical protein OsJ_25397 [Oryza sativa Japonica Group]|uniref:BLE2 protein n=1 Tax=Oryza sativa subsp. japonica TaxID=39947 RepID=B9FUL2_ORYSJ|nr:hypothetical protein OsJ_25397 [Oryza sativa Japonica Group]